jgi:acyl-CoA thioesterase-1
VRRRSPSPTCRGFPRPPRVRAARKLQRQHHVFQRGQRRQQLEGLEHEPTDCRAARRAVLVQREQVRAVDLHGAHRRRVQAGEDREQRGFARARGADHGDRLARRDAQVDFPQNDEVAVATLDRLADAARAENRFFVLFIFFGFAASAAPASKLLVYRRQPVVGLRHADAAGLGGLLEESLNAEHGDYSVANASISGETSAGGLARIAKTLERETPSIVILELGGNDGLRGLPVAAMKKEPRGNHRSRAEAGAKVLLVGMRMPPNYGEAYNKAFEQAFADLAKEYKTAFLPFLLEGSATRPSCSSPTASIPTEHRAATGVKNVCARSPVAQAKRK